MKSTQTQILVFGQNLELICNCTTFTFALMSGSSHIGSILIGVEYRNCHLTLDVYLLFAI